MGHFSQLQAKNSDCQFFFELLKEIRVPNAILLSIAVSWVMTFFDTTIPLHLEEIFDFDSEKSGYVFLALVIPSLFEPFVGKVCDKYGYRYIIAGGFFLMTPMLVLFRLPKLKTTGHIVMFIVFVAIMGFLMMSVFSPIMAEMSRAVNKIEARHPGIFGKNKGYGQAYGLFIVGFSLGSLFGSFHAGETRRHAGWDVLTVSLAIFTFGISVIALVFTEGYIFKRQRENAASAELDV